MPRAYRQTVRAAQTAETRTRILDAAHRAFTERGVQEVRMEDVAVAAGVGRSTVFLHFTTKADLLRVVEERAAERAGTFALVESVLAAPPVPALRSAVFDGSRIWERERQLFREFYGVGRTDPELRPLVSAKEDLRRSLLARVVARAAAERALADGWDAEAATDAVWVLTSFDTYDRLRARSPEPAPLIWALVSPVLRPEVTPAAE